MNEDTILITEKDMLRLQHILSFQKNDDYENLELELERAKIISEDEAPTDLVTMNTKVRFLIIQDNKESEATVVYPSEVNEQENKISVLTSLGSALLGLRTGQQINWMFPEGKTKTIKILDVLYQPEANQHWHL